MTLVMTSAAWCWPTSGPDTSNRNPMECPQGCGVNRYDVRDIPLTLNDTLGASDRYWKLLLNGRRVMNGPEGKPLNLPPDPEGLFGEDDLVEVIKRNLGYSDKTCKKCRNYWVNKGILTVKAHPRVHERIAVLLRVLQSFY